MFLPASGSCRRECRLLPTRSQWLRTEAGLGSWGPLAVMPRYYEDKPEGGACAGVKEDLGACLLQSDCVLQVAQPGARGDETLEPERQGPAKVSRSACGGGQETGPRVRSRRCRSQLQFNEPGHIRCRSFSSLRC